MRYVTVLGATGSIGKSTLDVIRRHPDLFSVYGLVASTSIDAMIDSIREFKPKVVAMSSEKAAIEVLKRVKELQLPCEVLFGDDGVETLAGDGSADIVVGAIVGAAGLRPLIAAAKTGCIIALANKEALVMSGTIFFETAKKYGARVLPVDSEHSAIFQSLPFEVQENLGFCNLKSAHVDKILLTGSGGPFRDTPIKDLEFVDAKTAIAHPVWSMGPKISVDSATMMNKGLEFIEARYLFNADDGDIQVVIHPQSVIHSMVSYEDGAVMAQLGNPDMRTPIAVALGFPERISSGVNRLDFTKLSSLTFMEPDFSRYPCLKLAMQASKSGQSATTALNAANEVAVASFLESKIKFTDISCVVDTVLCSNTCKEPNSIDEVLSIDESARKRAIDYIGKLNG
ncbi:MAG: 1-deoxy-D-xylulose-5-phosphate reductoisomerase [Succinivibrio sp.]|uniref:1-deoxy-D-xylulose 5-phosphate reductoisomerase n=1 Tax=Succinivibrio faecicola TaxID=2820300 RepID=A0ABS7DF66_9GAMM|nr:MULTISPECIES: 1-deoxy-D-xylulose-5-phosphate reductoisomerase [Succinivibrio]MBW7569747.1 1-deoxy-D-xylulose-5-phosphate reductoisomerase [Succinivibrio faecicola]MCI6939062.1 1-deoxy-D-xylulose-5-phosphate reductoisomerase [Succinatimonas hippei]MDD6205949.1 1-deoxy-D-xylulose-5-phosphate reductoisomerase [Succinivibrio sp.]